jgi:hypothetical protein
LWIAEGSLLAGAGPAARAQEPAPKPKTVRVQLVDATSGAPVVGAEVSVVRGLRQVVTRAVTDDAGQRVLSVPGDSGDYQVVIRKIGYRRADRFFPAVGRDTLVLAFSMAHAVQSLEVVTVTAKEDAARKSYYIDEEEIANSDRPLLTSVDIIEKLRPDMIWGRGGAGVCRQKLSNVFINGRRIPQAPMAGILAASARALPRAAMGTSAGRSVQIDKNRVTGMPAAILSSIRPEHIAEMTYNDCFEKSVKVNRGANALFVILKPGVGFSMDDGSYVLETPGSRREARGAPAESTAAFPSWRVRLLGVFDNDSGEAVEGAEVVDVLTGTRATTTTTGTVSLAFLPEGGSEVRVQKAGYRPITIEVIISPRDTVPITLTLAKVK